MFGDGLIHGIPDSSSQASRRQLRICHHGEIGADLLLAVEHLRQLAERQAVAESASTAG
jgi:hypothetical protein